MQLNGIAHIQLSVTNLTRARAFWAPLLELFEMQILIDTEDYFYCIGSRTGIALTSVDAEKEDDSFDQRRSVFIIISVFVRASENMSTKFSNSPRALARPLSTDPARMDSPPAITRSCSKTQTEFESK